jgi:hypothetical protein
MAAPKNSLPGLIPAAEVVPGLPQILAVDHRNRRGTEIEIVEQPRIDPNPRVLEIRLTGRPI